ncbi:MAG: SprT-like domain-containing protein [Oscillospiraceae bacterium]|nr:SprT-like domain-containing protein [Oscillospiraceae bacterium]
MMYKHVKTGALAELIGTIEDGVTLKDVATGETKEVKNITLRRWWKAVEEKAAEAETETAAETAQDTQNETETSEAEEVHTEEEKTDTETEDKPLALSEIVSKLENLFDLLNRLYFEDKLPRPVITVQSTPRAYGHCTTKKIWNTGEEDNGRYEINIGAEYLNRPSENTAATMLHEMVHLYCRENDLTETCQNGRYHNKLFKQEAEARGLIIDYDRANGYSTTTPSESFIETLRENGYVLEVPFARHTLGKKSKKASRVKAHAYTCPCCGQTVRTTGELSLICGICEVVMERAD